MSQDSTTRIIRLTRCAACGNTFTYSYRVTPELGDNLLIKLSCPFCQTRLQVDLSPYSRKQITSYKTAGQESAQPLQIELNLPDELQTTIRKQ